MANVKRVVAVAGAAVVGSLILLTAGSSSAVVAPPPPPPPVPVPPSPGPVSSQADIAERLVTTVAGVKAGEVVWIMGNSADLPFIEAIELAVWKQGGQVLLELSSDALQKQELAQVSAAYDGQTPKVALAYAKLANVVIRLPRTQDESMYLGYSPDRAQIQRKAYAPVEELLRKRNVRQVFIDNGMYPGISRTKETQLPPGELAKRFWAGLGADYSELARSAAGYQAWLGRAKEIHITAINGTDLTFQVKGRKVFASDGVISAADVKAGGAQVLTYLPAGEVFLVPVPGTMKGKFVDDRNTLNGVPINSITAEVDKGKITKLEAKQGWEFVKPTWDAASPAKAEVGVFDLGINPAVTATATFEPYAAAGMVTLGIGGNGFAGGTNREPFVMNFALGGCTVLVDGVTLVDHGVLQPPPAAPTKPLKPLKPMRPLKPVQPTK